MEYEVENKSPKINEPKTSIFDYLRFGESYTSLILGIIVVIISTVLLLSFIHNKNVSQQAGTKDTMSQQTKRTVPNLAQDSQVLTATPVPSSIETPTPEPTHIPSPTVIKKRITIAVPTKVKPTVTPQPTNKPQPTKVVKKATPTPAPTKVAKKVRPTEIAKTVTPAPTKLVKAPTVTSQSTKVAQTPAQPIKGSTYTIVKGDTLWSIAEKKYKSGYNWIDIQRANKLNNASRIHAGNTLVLPEVSSKMATVTTEKTTVKNDVKKDVVQKNDKKTTVQSNKISGDSYTIVKGDTLWSISVRAYGDGYSWKKIANANKLTSPSLIHSGNKLKIPRS